MKKTGLFKAMKLCMDYKKAGETEKRNIRQKRLDDLISHARENSPYYSNLYCNLPQDASFSDLPPVNKKDLMENWNDWVCDRNLTLAKVEKFMEDKDNIGRWLDNKYLVFTTSGSTGNPLVAVYDKTANNIMGGIAACRSYARKEDLKAFMKRGRKSMAVFADGGFYLGNSSVRSRLLSMPWKKKQMAISSALYPVDKIVQQLNDFQPDMLGGYPSNLELLIDEANAGRLNISPVIIMTGGEYLSDDLRARLSETFKCYVQTAYSCTEGGTVACECSNQHFHINDDWLIVEPVDSDGNPVPDGVLSDKIYLTNLYNYTQPYIRYEITDRVIMHHSPCGCGNTSPWIELEGRTDDVTVFDAGENKVRIPPLSMYAVMKEMAGIRRFQLLVYDDNKVEMRLEEADGADKNAVFSTACHKLKEWLCSQGVTSVTVTLTEDLPQQNPDSGKYKHVINMQK
ncbi:MAG: phenylacetate--CoA ligase family protein [Oscillospiraceae bacterium]|nr:phenylacetate--CoA ligase family protein [Oscillospiraceae bacterium]